jgi:hypothetical protein
MAKLSILENKLNDIQLKNLKMFPLIFFNGVSQAEIEYDLSISKPSVDFDIEHEKVLNDKEPNKLDAKYSFDRPTHKSMVEYKLTIDENQINDFLDNRFLALEKAVRSLFWKEVRIIILFNDKKVYETKNG